MSILLTNFKKLKKDKILIFWLEPQTWKLLYLEKWWRIKKYCSINEKICLCFIQTQVVDIPKFKNQKNLVEIVLKKLCVKSLYITNMLWLIILFKRNWASFEILYIFLHLEIYYYFKESGTGYLEKIWYEIST